MKGGLNIAMAAIVTQTPNYILFEHLSVFTVFYHKVEIRAAVWADAQCATAKV